MTPVDYASQVAGLDAAGRRRFYETLAFNLTIAGRQLWSDQFLTPDEKFEGLKWLNEVQHCVIGKLRAIEGSTTDGEFFDLMYARAEVCEELTVPLAWAIRQSYDYASGAERPAG